MRTLLLLVLGSSLAIAAPHHDREDIRVEGTPMSVLVDHDTIAWATSLGEVWTRPTSGGRAFQLTEQHADGFALGLVRADGRVFAPMDEHDVMEIDLATGRSSHMKLGLADDPITLVAGEHALYAVLFRKPDIVRIPLDGGKPKTLFTVPRAVIAMSPDTATIYAASYTTGELVSHPTTGGRTRTIARRLPHPTALAADSTFVYVSCETDRTIRRIDLATGSSIELAKGPDNADQLVADGPWLYYYSWVGKKRGQLLRVAKEGGHPPEILADDLDSPIDFTVDGRSIWIANRDAGTIVRLAKP